MSAELFVHCTFVSVLLTLLTVVGACCRVVWGEGGWGRGSSIVMGGFACFQFLTLSNYPYLYTHVQSACSSFVHFLYLSSTSCMHHSILYPFVLCATDND